MYRERRPDLLVHRRRLPDDESYDTSQKYIPQKFKTRTPFIFFQQTIIFCAATTLVERSCARRDNEIHEIHVRQKGADRSIEIDVERRSESEREGGGSEIKKKLNDWLPLHLERSRAMAN